MKKEYEGSIQEIMKEKEKSLRNLIDPDKITSMSGMNTTTKMDQTANSNSGKSSKVQPSQTREKESSSKISDNSSTS